MRKSQGKAEGGKRNAEPRCRFRAGMTLVELLVVLTILALLTVVAVTSSDVLLGQGRYDATVKTLNAIEEAVFGPANAKQSDGTVLSSGFLADMGWLPQADASLGLSQLWYNPGTMPPFAIRPASVDPEVLVPCGWRGPYLRVPIRDRLPNGENAISDGWGRGFLLKEPSGNAAAAGDFVSTIVSLGADGAPGGTQYDRDLTLVLNEPTRCAMAVGVRVNLVALNGVAFNPAAEFSVALYAPERATATQVDPIPVLRGSTPGGTGTITLSSTSFSTSMGTRFLRAYLGPITTPLAKSPIVRIQQGGLVDLTITVATPIPPAPSP